MATITPAGVRGIGLISLLIGCLAFPEYSLGEDRPAVVFDRSSNQDHASTTRCGLYALKAASSALGVDLSTEKLFGDNRFISTPEGSTGGDLISACRQFDLGAAPVTGLTSQDLFASDTPLLLNLSWRGGIESGGHWVAMIGTDGKQVQLYDNVLGRRLKDPGELDLLWDGSAIAIGRGEKDASNAAFRLNLISMLRRAIWLIAAVLLMLSMTWFLNGLGRRLGHRADVESTRRPFVLALLVLIGVAWFSLPSYSIADALHVRSCVGIASVEDERHGREDDPVQFIRDVRQLKNALLVDVRLARDFDRGSIPDATSLPINASPEQWLDFARRLENAEQVVFFCQSAACPWAATCASRMRCLEREAFVYAGGYRRYVEESTITPIDGEAD